jgi:carbon monoxide dehydrogenase subunit G
MTITVPVELGFEFDVNASADEVFDVLANVPDSASHYPKVDRLTDIGDGAYRWEMAKIGVGSLTLQTVYASRYVGNKAKGTVHWTPVEGEGNAQVSGSWKISAKKKATHIQLQIQAELSLPLPALMKMVAAPLVESEFEKMTEQYISNLIQRFGGEAEA